MKPLLDTFMKKRLICFWFLLGVMLGTGIACAHRPRSFNFGRYSEAETLFQKGEYDKAIQEYQAYVDENPEGHLAVISQYYIGKSYAELGRAQEAKKVFEAIIRKYPEVVWAIFSRTQLEELAGKSAADAKST